MLYQGVKGVTDLMVMPGLINLDFADVRTVMGEMGKAMMGTGEAEGESRAVDAAEKAIANPLLDDVSLQGARGVLINITGGYDLKLFEVDEAANRIKQEVDPTANIIVGSCFDDAMQGMMRVSVVATGIEAESAAALAEEAPELAAPAGGALRRPARAAVDPNSGELRPAARHAVRRAAVSQPKRTMPVQQPAAVEAEDDFEIDEQSVAAVAAPGAQRSLPMTETRAVASSAVASGQDLAATGTMGGGRTFGAESVPMQSGHAGRATQAVATVVDPGIAEAPTADMAPPSAPAKRGLSALGGLNLIRQVADSFSGGRSEQPKRGAPVKDKSLDKDDDENGDLKIPAFLRRQAN